MKKKVILLSAGSGTRMQAGVNKIFLELCGKSLLRRSMEAFWGLADEMVLVYRPGDDTEHIQEIIRAASLDFPVHLVPGGSTRQESVLFGARSLVLSDDDLLLIHDAARCLVDPSLIIRVVEAAVFCGGAVPGIQATSTYKLCDSQLYISGTPDRSCLYEIQTPQIFNGLRFLDISEKAAAEGFIGTDDASLFEHAGLPVKIVAGSRKNIKITTPDDLHLAQFLLEGEAPMTRVGFGYDVHRLVPDRKLILCGIEIPYEFGLLGHSDADVALHALMDAMLGAASLGDIGKHFPDKDPQYKGISSVFLLKETNRLLAKAGYRVNNADITIVAEMPKLLPYIPSMVSETAKALEITADCVNVKATTTEKLGFEGRSEGISASAVCSIIPITALGYIQPS